MIDSLIIFIYWTERLERLRSKLPSEMEFFTRVFKCEEKKNF